MKKKILGMSDAWLTSRLSHRPSEPAYYIVDFRISSCFCMSCIYVHNDAFHCRHFPRKILRAIIFNIHHQHQHNRGIRGRGFVTIGHKTSEAAPPPTKPSSFILRLCLCNYLYFSSLPTYYVPPWLLRL